MKGLIVGIAFFFSLTVTAWANECGGNQGGANGGAASLRIEDVLIHPVNVYQVAQNSSYAMILVFNRQVHNRSGRMMITLPGTVKPRQFPVDFYLGRIAGRGVPYDAPTDRLELHHFHSPGRSGLEGLTADQLKQQLIGKELSLELEACPRAFANRFTGAAVGTQERGTFRISVQVRDPMPWGGNGYLRFVLHDEAGHPSYFGSQFSTIDETPNVPERNPSRQLIVYYHPTEGQPTAATIAARLAGVSTGATDQNHAPWTTMSNPLIGN